MDFWEKLHQLLVQKKAQTHISIVEIQKIVFNHLEDLLTDTSEVVLFSDMSAIVGSADLYQYVENTYDQLKSQEIQKKSQKLLEQVAFCVLILPQRVSICTFWGEFRTC